MRSVCLIIKLSDLWRHLPQTYTIRLVGDEYSRTFTPEEDPTLGDVYEWFRNTVPAGIARCEAMVEKMRTGMEKGKMLEAKSMDDLSWLDDFMDTVGSDDQ